EVVGMGLGPKIRGLREQVGVSQARLAAQAELSQGYLSQIENDEVQNPSAAVLFRLAQALHVDPRCLLEAAGYQEAMGVSGDVEYETPVDPDLLRFLARLSLEQQGYLLRFLRGMERETPVEVG
ncbi:MAG TPA: helix-turn-helix transcriptional regulator, partial [Dehalococcoidia bacterium]|nr:helix-turn-helix transcriptional regulator [Dehalococcoidia bacterium]